MALVSGCQEHAVPGAALGSKEQQLGVCAQAPVLLCVGCRMPTCRDATNITERVVPCMGGCTSACVEW